MSLSSLQRKQIQDALVAAFGNEDNLRQMLMLQMSINLESVTKPGNIAQRTFDVVTWADEQGRVSELVHAACAENPQNPELQSLAESSSSWHIAAPTPAEASPYKGLEFYGVADAALFFGREKLIAELVAYLRDHRFLTIVGASGSGKSSVVRAGVIPALQKGEIVKGSDKWAVHIVTPTARPLTTLATELTKESESVTAQATLMDDMGKDPRSLDLFAARLAAKAGASRVLLVVDQFEELFTLCKNRAEQQVYVDNLLVAAVPQGVTSVILTLRADFYARCAEFDNLRTALQDWQKYIGPMSREELRAAIEKPAAQNGWDFEPGLVDAILDDVAGEAGSLPLLSHALLETWKRRSGRTLTFSGYHAAGGVQGAIAKTADAVYAELPSDQQAIARNIFLRLTTLGEGTQDTRRRVPLPELLGSGTQAVLVQAVLNRLADDRLVTAERAATTTSEVGDKPEAVYVDVTHEALIREWPRLSAWLREDRAGLLVHRRLTEAAQEWEELKRDSGSLFRGALLVQTAEWATAHGGDLNDHEREFLDASQAQVAAEKRRGQRVVAGIVIGLALFAVAMAVLAVVANNRGIEADNAKATAQANLGLARQKLDELKVEELMASAHDKKAKLDATGAIGDLNAAVVAAAARGKAVDVSGEISDTLRYVATTYVERGEMILCNAFYDQPQKCTVPPTGQIAEPMTTSAVISQTYLAWAQDAAPQIVGWSSYTSTVQQQAVISATALFSPAMAFNPPPDTPVYVWIAPGTFEMGSTNEQCKAVGLDKCPSEEQPPHSVQLDGYWIQRTEVTNEQYKPCVESGVCVKPDNLYWDKPSSGRLPVTDVSWNQASTYATWVGGRLPTEAEWEYACRGADGYIYPWGDNPPSPERANFGYRLPGATEAGSYPPGANGLYDMAGNEWEFTADLFSAEYYASSPNRNPTGSVTGIYHTFRGGSWFAYDGWVRCAHRHTGLLSDKPAGNLGFRVVIP